MDIAGILISIINGGLIAFGGLAILGFFIFFWDLLALIYEAYDHFRYKKQRERDEIMKVLKS